MSLCVEEAVHELASIFLESLEHIGCLSIGSQVSVFQGFRPRQGSQQSCGEGQRWTEDAQTTR